MRRGLFENIIPDCFNKKSRNWNITLLRSFDVWCELSFSEDVLKYYRSMIREQINNVTFPKDDFERFPIYYISKRKKVRICKHIKYMSNNNIYLLICEGVRLKIIKIEISELAKVLQLDNSMGIVINVQYKYISCMDKNRKEMRMYVYDLLYHFGYKFKSENEILYVGYTQNPEDRPFKGTHEGLTQILYNYYDKRKEDIFISYQQFHVNSLVTNGLITIQSSNTMTNEIDIVTESKIIESSLIKYYLEGKRYNYIREENYLLNRLKDDLFDRKITSLIFLLDYKKSNSMFYYKDGRTRSKIVNFEIKQSNDKILLTTTST